MNYPLTENVPCTSSKTYRVEDIARILDISRSSAYNLVRAGHFKTIRINCYILDEDRKVNAQKFESAFYANPDLREVKAPQEQPTIDLANLLLQLQQNPELASALAGLLGQKTNPAS